MSSPGLFARLREQTAREHAALEASLPLLSASVARSDYVRFLTLIGAFHAAVEHRLPLVPGLADVIGDLPERRKTALLERDLAALGAHPAGVAPAGAFARLAASARGNCPLDSAAHAVVPSITSVERALGTLYVLEGSTLGGQHLHRHLSVALPDVMAQASRFLVCYGPRTASMWRAFKRQVEQAAPELDTDVVVDAAREAFAVLLDWFRPSEPGSAAQRVA